MIQLTNKLMETKNTNSNQRANRHSVERKHWKTNNNCSTSSKLCWLLRPLKYVPAAITFIRADTSQLINKDI